VTGAAISPDGKYLAYSDNTGTYLKQTRNGETHSVPLPANFQARADDWFPDGSHLLVSRQQRKFMDHFGVRQFAAATSKRRVEGICVTHGECVPVSSAGDFAVSSKMSASSLPVSSAISVPE
jgi:hypothetical protein